MQENNYKYASNSFEYSYKYPTCEFPKSFIDDTNSRNSTRFETKNKSNKIKKVQFNKNVTVINIKSYKKEIKKNNHRTFEDDVNYENQMKCVNCNIY